MKGIEVPMEIGLLTYVSNLSNYVEPWGKRGLTEAKLYRPHLGVGGYSCGSFQGHRRLHRPILKGQDLIRTTLYVGGRTAEAVPLHYFAGQCTPHTFISCSELYLRLHLKVASCIYF